MLSYLATIFHIRSGYQKATFDRYWVSTFQNFLETPCFHSTLLYNTEINTALNQQVPFRHFMRHPGSSDP